jgi:hypothetical protein
MPAASTRAGSSRAKMQFPIHPHMLRHGCGYALANARHDTRALQAWLGHKNIQHTVRYTSWRRIGSRTSGARRNTPLPQSPCTTRSPRGCAHQAGDRGAAEIQRVAQIALRWPDVSVTSNG